MTDALLISTRSREVWTRDEWKQLDRAAILAHTHGLKLLLRCANEVCPEPQLAFKQDRTAAEGAILRCGCTDRVLAR